MSLATKVVLKTEAQAQKNLDLGVISFPLSFSKVFDLLDGDGANRANQVYAAQRTLAAAQSEDLVLTGVLKNAFGDILSFTAIKAIFIAAAGENTNNVVVGGNAANGHTLNSWVNVATDQVKVRPGGAMVLVAPDATGYAAVAGSADTLKISNGGAGSSVTYDVVIVGVATTS